MSEAVAGQIDPKIWPPNRKGGVKGAKYRAAIADPGGLGGGGGGVNHPESFFASQIENFYGPAFGDPDPPPSRIPGSAHNKHCQKHVGASVPLCRKVMWINRQINREIFTFLGGQTVLWRPPFNLGPPIYSSTKHEWPVWLGISRCGSTLILASHFPSWIKIAENKIHSYGVTIPWLNSKKGKQKWLIVALYRNPWNMGQ